MKAAPKPKLLRHELLLPAELKARVDAARGLIPLNPWVRRLMERECDRIEALGAAE